MKSPTLADHPFTALVVYLLCLMAFIGMLMDLFAKKKPQDKHQHFPDSEPSLYAVLVSTNLVSQPCPCGFCDYSKGIAVPEHIGVVGCDLRIEVSTNLLPVISIPARGKEKKKGEI